MRALLVEDDPVLGDGLRAGLEIEGVQVDWLTCAEEAALALDAGTFDAVILDLGLPDGSGRDVLKAWRRDGHRVPVLILTAHDTKANCLETLNGGADDYVVKPVDLDELMARLKALKRRTLGQADNRLVAGPLTLDLTARTGAFADRPLDLSRHEFIVLEALASRGEQPVSRGALEERLYGWGEGPESNALEVLIHKIRGKIGRDRIRTVRGIGWRLAP